MHKLLALVPVAIGLASTPAYAQAVSGRAELRVGYDEVRTSITVDEFRRDEFGGGGVSVGAEVGGDVTFGNGILFGAYGGVDFSQAEGCKGELIFNDDEGCIDAGRNLYAGLRAGLRTSDNGLVYIKGGYSNAKLDVTYFDGDDVIIDADGSVGGVHLGGGFELDVTNRIYVKGEYTHTWYNDAFKSDLADDQSLEPTRHQLMFGVGLRFGGPAAPPPPAEVLAPPPPPPAAPLTQTCPDGSVIDAAAMCPAPPPPPPPVPTDNGERG